MNWQSVMPRRRKKRQKSQRSAGTRKKSGREPARKASPNRIKATGPRAAPFRGAALSASHDGLILWSSCIIATLVLYYIFSRYLPTEFGTLGHDYSYFMPRLLLGYYWFQQNGLWAVPWFTPGLCGGLPFYANPQSLYYSLPQFATFFTDPLTAVRTTFLLFGALGYAGSYLLLRRVLGLGVPAALFGAVVFAFNGFFAHRLLIGHLTFHSFMLVPWAAFWLLREPPEGQRLDP